MKLATYENITLAVKGEGTRESTVVTRILRDSILRSTALSAGKSNTSRKHSRYVSSTIGNDGCREAAANRSLARFLCAHSGERFCGFRRGKRRARAAHSRKRALNTDVSASAWVTSVSTSEDAGKNS